MENKDDFKAEVSSDGNYVLIAIKIPTFTCAACGAVVKAKVNTAFAAQMFTGHNAINSMFSSSSESGFGVVFGAKTPSPGSYAGYKQEHAVVCAACYEPIARIEENEKVFIARSKQIENDALALRVKTWKK